MVLVRFLQGVIVVCLTGIVLVLFQAGAQSAGQVIFSQDHRSPGATQALNFDNASTERVFLSELQSGRPDYYAFRATKGTFLKVKLNVARLVGQDNFRPALALFGPGLPQATPGELRLLPFSLPPNAGLLVSETDSSNKAPRNKSDEPWTQAGYWERQSLVNELPEDGTYFLAVYSRDEQRGKYAMVVGDKVETSLRETLTFPVTWARVHYWFEDLWWPSFALVMVGLGLLGLLALYFRLVGRQVRTVSFARANARRSDLLQKRLTPGWNRRRIGPQLRPGQPNLYPSPKPLPRIKPALTLDVLDEMKQLAEAERPTRPEQPLLVGSKWETLATTAPLVPALLVSGNGHNGVKPGTNGNGNRRDLPGLPPPPLTPVRDGLSQWGQRLRPSLSEDNPLLPQTNRD